MHQEITGCKRAADRQGQAPRLVPSRVPLHRTQTAFVTVTGPEEESPERGMVMEFKELIASSGGVI